MKQTQMNAHFAMFNMTTNPKIYGTFSLSVNYFTYNCNNLVFGIQMCTQYKKTELVLPLACKKYTWKKRLYQIYMSFVPISVIG